MARTKGLNSPLKRTSALAIPILVLLVDFALFPRLLQSQQAREGILLAPLLDNRTQLLGTHRGHRIYVALDDIGQERFLSYLKGTGTALVISIFVYPRGDDGAGAAALAKAVIDKLGKVSPEDQLRLVDLLEHSGQAQPGKALSLKLTVPSEGFATFPVNHLYIVVFERGNTNDQDQVLKDSIPEIMGRLEEDGISNLILPCVGYNWEDKNSLTFNQFFGAFFQVLPGEVAPRTVYLTLYSQWPTSVLEEAVLSLNAQWQNNFPPSVGRFPELYRKDLRLTLVASALCLFVCSYYAPLTPRNFLTISVGFLGVVLGSSRFTDFLLQGYGPGLRLVVQLVVLGAAAIGFPFIVNWNPKNIFGASSE